MSILITLGKILLSLLMSLISEQFLKRLILMGIRHLASRNPQKDMWDELESGLREAWNVNNNSEENK